jgi:hypothetical protein
MVKVIRARRKRLFDEEADWVPPKNRYFVLKGSNQGSTVPAETSQAPRARPQPEPKPPEPKPQQAKPQDQKPERSTAQPKRTTDAEGLRQASKTDTRLYLDPQGTVHVAGTQGSPIGQEWRENYKVFGPNLLKKFTEDPGQTLKDQVNHFIGTGDRYDIESMDRYKQLDKFMQEHRGEVKNMVGYSKGASVVDAWMKNNPDFAGNARLYGTPYDDMVGKERFKDWLNKQRAERQDFYTKGLGGPQWLQDLRGTIAGKEQDFFEYMTGMDQVQGMEERHQMRIADPNDPVTFFDGSATRMFADPTWYKHILTGEGGGHYYGNTAALFAGFDGPNKGFIGNEGKGLPRQQDSFLETHVRQPLANFFGVTSIPSTFMPGSAEEQKDPNAQFSAP